jgi:hypothetical protein
LPRLPSLLDRFRRLLVPPGRPAETLGVPASGADLEGELGGLLGDLDAIGQRASELRAQARERAERRRAEAAREAAALLERARGWAEGERARAAAEQRSQAEGNAAAARTAARREADRVRAAGDKRVAELLAEVLECVRRSGR